LKAFSARHGLLIQRLNAKTSFGFQRSRILTAHGVEAAIDCGANIGQYASQLRRWGHVGPILSIEPASEAYRRLTLAAARDPLWQSANFAVGEFADEATLNVAANSVSSSLYVPRDCALNERASAIITTTETVAVKSLDTVIREYFPTAARIFLKLDIQGSELAALRGLRNEAERVRVLEVELSIEKLYEGVGSWQEILAHVIAGGFELVGAEPNTFDPATCEAVEMNFLFARRNA